MPLFKIITDNISGERTINKYFVHGLLLEFAYCTLCILHADYCDTKHNVDMIFCRILNLCRQTFCPMYMVAHCRGTVMYQNFQNIQVMFHFLKDTHTHIPYILAYKPTIFGSILTFKLWGSAYMRVMPHSCLLYTSPSPRDS